MNANNQDLTSEEDRCEESYYDEVLDKYWMRRRCILLIGHTGPHYFRWEDDEEKDKVA